MKNKELINAFILECKQEQEAKERFKANTIEFDNYFKYSGEVELDQVLISHYKYSSNNFKSGNQLHEQFIKTKEYEKLWKDKASKNYPGRFSKAIEAYYWDEAKDSVWSD